MIVSYETQALRDVFQFPAKAIERYGAEVARVLAIRFADLQALPSGEELEIFAPQKLVVQGMSALRLDLANGYSMVLVQAHTKKQPTSWVEVRRVRVLTIEGPETHV